MTAVPNCPLCSKPTPITHEVVWEADVTRAYCSKHAIEVHERISMSETTVRSWSPPTSG